MAKIPIKNVLKMVEIAIKIAIQNGKKCHTKCPKNDQNCHTKWPKLQDTKCPKNDPKFSL